MNNYNVPGLEVYADMGVPTTTSDGLVSWKGNSMAPLRVYPKLSGQLFEAGAPGIYTVSAPVPKGVIDVWLTTGTAGSAFNLAALYQSTIPAVILIGLDSQNRPQCVVQDNTGAAVASSTPAGSAIATGVRMHLQLDWDNSLASGLNHVTLYKDGAVLATLRTTTWTPFLAPSLYAGRAVPSFTDFNGTIESVQLGNQPAV